MSEVVALGLLFTGVGLLFVAVGVPLFQGRVPPNQWYGCRTHKTLSSRRVWYEANRVTGLDMILAGVLVIITSLVVLAFGRGASPDSVATVLVSVMVCAVLGMAFHGLSVVRRL